MRDSIFVGLDVHEATISVAVARETMAVRSVTGVRYRIGPIMFESWWRSWQRAGADRCSAMKRGLAAMAFIASSSKWGMTASWWRHRSFR